jgi:plasmid stabilization system protein ParE
MFPESGPIVPERSDRRVREVIVQPYRILYRQEGQTVQVIGIYHGAQQLPRSEIQ